MVLGDGSRTGTGGVIETFRIVTSQPDNTTVSRPEVAEPGAAVARAPMNTARQQASPRRLLTEMRIPLTVTGKPVIGCALLPRLRTRNPLHRAADERTAALDEKWERSGPACRARLARSRFAWKAGARGLSGALSPGPPCGRGRVYFLAQRLPHEVAP